MGDEGFKRKLAAILSADVEGYSRLMGDDENATVKTLAVYKDVFKTLIVQNRGSVVDSPGDNILAEFASVVDAVQCAVAVQKELTSRNLELPKHRRMQFRIGVNLGDVIEEGDRIYGDGVNVASRLESLSEAGGILISKTAFDQIESKLPYGYEFLGDQTVKNIAKPVGAYRVLMDPRVTMAGEAGKKRPSISTHKLYLVGATAVLVLAIAIGLWQFYTRRPAVEPASIEKMAFPLPEKPSIAVLPFDNMSGDPEQGYLSDGLTESIITAISKIRNLFVIARHSTFAYKGKAVKVQQVAQDLGVQYVLEGSVQRAGNRLRVTAQLVDALTGRHIWSERYDRDMKELFSMQDEIGLEILEAMRVKLIEGEQVSKAQRPQRIESALKLYQAVDYSLRFTPEAMTKAKNLTEEVVAEEPTWGEAHYILSTIHMMEIWYGTGKSPQDSLMKATEFAEKAISLDGSLSQAMGILGYLYGIRRQWDKSVATAEQGVAIDPNGADAHAWLGNCLNFANRYQEAIPFFEKAMRLNPYPPAWYYFTFSVAYTGLKRYEEAIALLEKSISISPNSLTSYISLIRPYFFTGREEDARNAAKKVLQIDPNFSVEKYVNQLPYREPGFAKNCAEAYRKAGLK